MEQVLTREPGVLAATGAKLERTLLVSAILARSACRCCLSEGEKLCMPKLTKRRKSVRPII